MKRFPHHGSLQGPIRIDWEAAFPRPLTHYVARDRSRGLRPSAPYWHTTTPDIDNLAKLINDTLQGISLFKNDSQVVSGITSKVYEGRQGPGLALTLIWGEGLDRLVPGAQTSILGHTEADEAGRDGGL
jgi:Holliday junction resolvase RusA-like endonuclease